jgi:S1-C subfamily serine protease
METNGNDSNRRELFAAATLAWALLLAFAGAALVFGGSDYGASADEVAGSCARSSCRVSNQLPGGIVHAGSGTLVDATADSRHGLVLTCAHLFSEGKGRITITFPGGACHEAVLSAIDDDADLAALEIASPQVMPVEYSPTFDPRDQLRACGFGGDGVFRCVGGAVCGAAESPGQRSLRLAGAVRNGDSGGGVFDSRGRIVAVVWGESGGETYASTGAPLKRFLEQVLRRPQGGDHSLEPTTVAACPNGLCPRRLPSPGPFGSGGMLRAGPPSAAAASQKPCDCQEKLEALARQLQQQLDQKQDRGDYLTRDEAGQFADRGAVESLAQRQSDDHRAVLDRLDHLPASAAGLGRAAGAVAATAIGLTGPAGLAVVAGATVAGWLVGRRIRRRANRRGEARAEGLSRSEVPSKEATAAAADSFRDVRSVTESNQPIERDDVETRQLLRLSQLEGRDPLQDAVAGRIALDRLDAIAESDQDANRATWADELRRELRERFNDIAPAKFVAA